MDLKIWPAHTRHFDERHESVSPVRESPSVPENSAARSAVIAAVIFIIAHLALLVGVTTPEKFYFDEVHYVPAARQMLEPVMPIADAQSDASAAGQAVDRRVDPHLRGCAAGLALPGRAVRIAGDRRDVSLRPRAVRGARPRDRDGLARLLQPDGVRAVADRDAGYICAGVRPVGDRGVHARLPQGRGRIVGSRSPASHSVSRSPANGADCSRSPSAS